MDTRTRLLDAALTLFADRGYDAVGVQDVVEAAGCTKPTLYHHFGSKRGLLEELGRVHGERLAREIEQAARYEGDVPLTLTRVVRVAFRSVQDAPVYWRLQLAAYHAPPESEAMQVLGPYMARTYVALQRLFEAAAPDHGAFRGRAERYALGFFGTLLARMGWHLWGHGALDDELAFLTAHQFMHGIYS